MNKSIPTIGADDPSPWRDRAKEIRGLAEVTIDAETAEIMRTVASGYERLAARLEEVAKAAPSVTRLSRGKPDASKAK